MKTTAIEKATKTVVAKLAKASPSGRVGIREVALAVEEAVPGATIEQIHAAVLKVATFFPSDDPRDPNAARQYEFGWQPDWTTDQQSRRVWVCERQ